MTKDQINEFTLKISASNPTGIISVLFEIYFAYDQDARVALETKDYSEFLHSVGKCSEVITHLQNDLDFKYEIAKQLYPLYAFCQRSLAKSTYQATIVGLDESAIIMGKLKEAFSEIAKNDKSSSVMTNAQQVVAGMTYGRAGLNENMNEGVRPRGFFA